MHTHMTWLQFAFCTLLVTALGVAWYRYSLEKGLLLRRLAELYLWLVPISLAWFAVIRDVAGLRVTVVMESLHLLLIAAAFWFLGGRPTVNLPARADVSVRLASFLARNCSPAQRWHQGTASSFRRFAPRSWFGKTKDGFMR